MKLKTGIAVALIGVGAGLIGAALVMKYRDKDNEKTEKTYDEESLEEKDESDKGYYHYADNKTGSENGSHGLSEGDFGRDEDRDDALLSGIDDPERIEKAARELGDPYVISPESFMNEELEYSKTTYTYYAEDHVLVDENYERVTDVSQIFRESWGPEEIEELFVDDVFYIRNDRCQFDLEIVCEHSSYEREILGGEPVSNEEAVENALKYFGVYSGKSEGEDDSEEE